MAEDYKPRSSPQAFTSFMEGSIHIDFQEEINVRIEDLRDMLESGESKKIYEARGALKLARELKDIFINLRDNRIADIEEEAMPNNRQSIV